MFHEFVTAMAGWEALDTWIVVTGALAAMSCALPGTWLLLRRQSLLGDALSHSILPGIVLAYMTLNEFENRGWVHRSPEIRHLVAFFGAAASGVLSAVITEFLQRFGRVERSAAIGVVFTSMFALGLLLIRRFQDQTHVDPGCVLYGSLEASVFGAIANRGAIPPAAVINAILLGINGLLVLLFFKELRLSTFDPGLAETLGVNAQGIQLVLMAMTAATLVAAFESVGAILVIAMLIVPPATARLLTDRLGLMLIFSLVVAAASALLGHIGALTLPSMVFSRLGYPEVKDASTTGMMAVAAGGLFLLSVVCSPKHGIIRFLADRAGLKVRIAGEDILGKLYRYEETTKTRITNLPEADLVSRRSWTAWLAIKRLLQAEMIASRNSQLSLTEKGRELAKSLVRSHRLWEAYMARHFTLPGDHLHATAEEVEHFLSPELQSDLASELDQPDVDPHGKAIP